MVVMSPETQIIARMHAMPPFDDARIPIWYRGPAGPRAVEAGRVERVDGFLWHTAGSVSGDLAIVEDLRKAFVA